MTASTRQARANEKFATSAKLPFWEALNFENLRADGSPEAWLHTLKALRSSQFDFLVLLLDLPKDLREVEMSAVNALKRKRSSTSFTPVND